MRKMRILVVDDEALIVQMLKKALETDELEIVGKPDGQAALDYFLEHPVDLVISDIMMPKLSGTQLFHELKKVDPFIQVILITGYPSLETIVEMLEGGACDFVIKPYKIDDIRKIVLDNLDRIKRWRELRKIWFELKRQKQ